MFLKVISLIIPISFFFMHFFLKNKANKKISVYSGFRTRLSMKNKDNWRFANRYASKLSLYFGIISLFMTIFIIIKYELNDNMVLLLCGIQILLLILISIMTEIKLYNKNKG